jgi:hypothetical protein
MEGAWIKWTHKGGTINGSRIAIVLERSDGPAPSVDLRRDLKEMLEHISYDKFLQLKKSSKLIFQ